MVEKQANGDILAFSLRMDMMNLICDYSHELKTMGINKGTARNT